MTVFFSLLLALSAYAGNGTQVHLHPEMVFDQVPLREVAGLPALFLPGEGAVGGLIFVDGKLTKTMNDVPVGANFCHFGIRRLPGEAIYTKRPHTNHDVVETRETAEGVTLLLERDDEPATFLLACFQRASATAISSIKPTFSVVADALSDYGYPDISAPMPKGQVVGPAIEIGQ